MFSRGKTHKTENSRFFGTKAELHFLASFPFKMGDLCVVDALKKNGTKSIVYYGTYKCTAGRAAGPPGGMLGGAIKWAAPTGAGKKN